MTPLQQMLEETVVNSPELVAVRAALSAQGPKEQDEDEVIDTIDSLTPGERANRTMPSVKALVKMTAKHRRIAQLKVAGMSQNQIADHVGCRHSWVSAVLADPLVKKYIDVLHAQLDDDIRDLTAPAIDVMRSSMSSQNENIALQSATTILKMNGKFKDGGEGQGATAEDVVAQLFKRAAPQVAVQVNVSPREASEAEGRRLTATPTFSLPTSNTGDAP